MNSSRQVCTYDPCPVDCVLGTWGRWSECSTSCGPNGRQTRTRVITLPASLGGAPCNASDLIHVAPCEDVPCPVHCEWANWGDWSKCTKECNGGITYRHRVEGVSSQYGGRQCEGSADEDGVVVRPAFRKRKINVLILRLPPNSELHGKKNNALHRDHLF